MIKRVGFPRSSRLLLPGDYSRVFAVNVRASDRYWTLLARRSDMPSSRLGMAIAKKRAKRAVDRNRLKRLVREHFRHGCSELANRKNGGDCSDRDLGGCMDVVVMNRDAATTASNEELRQSLDALWQKLERQLSKQRR